MPSLGRYATPADHLRLVSLVLDGYDSGVYTLPGRLVAARDAYRRIRETLAAAPVSARHEDDVLQAAAVSFAAGEPIDLTEAIAVRDARLEHEMRTGVLQAALTLTRDTLIQTVRDLQDEIVTEHLAPAQATVIRETRTAHAAYSPHGTDPADLLNAPKPARDAYNRLDELTRRWLTIRTAVDSVRNDQQHPEFAIIRNPETIWPALISNPDHAGSPPWPTDPREFLNFLATHPELEVWCPTVREQDTHGREVLDKQPVDAA